MVATISGSNEKTLTFLGGKSYCKVMSAMKVFCFHSPTPLSVFNCYQDVVYQTEEVAEMFLYPLHPNISIHILHTVICMFTEVLTRKICLAIKSFCSW